MLDANEDDSLIFENFYAGFMQPYFGCPKCPETKAAMSAINVVKDDKISWQEFEVFLKWAGKEYPQTETAEDLLEIAFRDGVAIAMRDEIIKQGNMYHKE